ncbi:MAG: glycosyltransferase [bacterium]
MDFIIIANAWSAGKDNPTSKHRIAIELVRQGHRVLWIEGSGMRTPSVGSSSDRLRMVRKVVASLRGARREEVSGGHCVAKAMQGRQWVAGSPESESSMPPHISHLTSHPSLTPPSLHILSPLFIPLPRYERVRRLNGLICRLSMRFWAWRLGFADPVLINYVPVLAEAMRGWRKGQEAEGQVAADVPAADCPERSLSGQNIVRRDGERHLGALSSDKSNIYGLKSKVSPRAPRVVYHCVDRWDAFAMYDSAMMGEMDQRCCRYADLVIASAGELYERCKAINPHTVLIPHGVDWEHFRRGVPKIPVSGPGKNLASDRNLSLDRNLFPVWGGCPHPPGSGPVREADEDIRPTSSAPDPASATIGFFGLLSEWVDQELILRLAQEFPRATMVLIGKADVAVTRLQGISNIQLLGPKPFSELPDYVAGFTVGIIPFVVNDLTRSVNPIKLREMLSAGCPVVSTDLPEVARYQRSNEGATPCPAVWGGCPHPPFPGPAREADGDIRPTPGMAPPPPVQVAHDHDEFVAKVRRVLERPLSPQGRRAVSDSMASETWTAKVGEILALLTNN